MEILHLIIIILFTLMLVSIGAWYLLYRGFNPDTWSGSVYHRAQQILIAVIATLMMVIAILIVLSSDPGDPDDYLFWY